MAQGEAEGGGLHLLHGTMFVREEFRKGASSRWRNEKQPPAAKEQETCQQERGFVKYQDFPKLCYMSKVCGPKVARHGILCGLRASKMSCVKITVFCFKANTDYKLHVP